MARARGYVLRAVLRWVELVVNTVTVMIVTAAVGIGILVVGILFAGGTITDDDFKNLFNDLTGRESAVIEVEPQSASNGGD